MHEIQPQKKYEAGGSVLLNRILGARHLLYVFAAGVD